MGVLQQSFNQSLTGATFLLQQTPWWKEKADTQKELSDLKKIHKSLPGLSENIEKKIENVRQSTELLGKGLPTEAVDVGINQSENLIGQYHEGLKEIQSKRATNPSLNKKFQKYMDRVDPEYNDNVKHIKSVIASERKLNEARQRIAELQDQYTSQKANTDAFKERLKAGNEHTTKAKQILRKLQGGKK